VKTLWQTLNLRLLGVQRIRMCILKMVVKSILLFAVLCVMGSSVNKKSKCVRSVVAKVLNQQLMVRPLIPKQDYNNDKGVNSKVDSLFILERRNNMSIDAAQLRNLIDETLLTMIPSMHSIEARELLMMTAAQESFCGRWIQQIGCGVALGIFEIEPNTYRDLFDNYLRYHPELASVLDENFNVHIENFELNLKGNLPYQIVIARLHYRRFAEKIPKMSNFNTQQHPEFTHAMACYYKKYWNTVKGKATIAEVLRNYDKYAS